MANAVHKSRTFSITDEDYAMIREVAAERGFTKRAVGMAIVQFFKEERERIAIKKAQNVINS